MTSGRYGLVLREVGRLLGGETASGVGAGQLLERFAADRDEAAFEALVGRHGPMVLGTCRRMLADPHDVDDAFQATFLVLARKAGSIRDADRLGPWLHGVARRVAARSRALSARRKSFERPAVEEPAAESPDLLEGSDLREALDEELARLPEKYRAPLVLCYLEGLTHDEAAEALRWPVGTVRSRLAGGRDRPRTRLARRGLAPSAAVPALLPTGALPPALLSTTVRVATSAGSAPAHVLNLAKGVLIAMTWNKLKMVTALGLMAGLTVGGAGLAAQKGEAGKAEARVEEMPTTVEQVEAEIRRIRFEEFKIEKQIKELRADLDTALRPLEKAYEDLNSQDNRLSQRLKELNVNAASTAVDDRIKRLEADLRASRAETQDVQRKLDTLATAIARPFPGPGFPKAEEAAKVADPAPASAVEHKVEAKIKEATTGTPPGVAGTKAAVSPSFVVNLGVDPPLFATITSRGDRVTMVDPTSKWKATYHLPGGLVTAITPSSAGNGLFPLAMAAHKINQLAVFDRLTWRWMTLDLGGTVAAARPVVGAGAAINRSGLIGFALNGTEITNLVAFNPWTREWISQDLKEPASGQLTPTLYPEVLAYPLGRYFYAYSVPAKKWATLELKRPIAWNRQGGGGLGGYEPKDGKIVVPEEDVVHIFDIKAGEWTHVDMKDEGAK
jgi:RNA polymerase sigma factor (sigma-70 family)